MNGSKTDYLIGFIRFGGERLELLDESFHISGSF